MVKIVDESTGWWTVKNNPLSSVGVFPYLGRQISDDLVPDKVYYVYRSADALRDSVESWNNPPRPIILGHEMLGDDFTKTDERPVQGVATNVYFDDATDTLRGDITIYSDELKNAIANNTKDVSLGYFCQYEKRPGVFNGQAYDFIQTGLRGNHVAVVEAGRCGPDVRVFDSKCAMDSLDINFADFQANDVSDTNHLNNSQDSDSKENKKETEMVDKREYIREIMAIAAKPDSDFDGGEKEKIETIAKLLEKSEYNKSERGTANDEDEKEKVEDKCGKDEEEEKKEKAEDSLDSEEVMGALRAIMERLDAVLAKKSVEDEDDKDSDEDKEEEKKDDKKAEDSALFVFGNKTAQDAANDPALMAYLAD